MMFHAGQLQPEVVAAHPHPQTTALEGAEAELKFEQREIDLGKVQGPTACEFPCINRGPARVRILGVKPSCSRCTIAAATNQVLRPGERGRIKVQIDPSAETVGRHAYAINLDWEGAVKRSTRLRVSLLVQPDLVVPDSVTIRSVAGVVATSDLEIIDYRDTPLDVISVTTSASHLRARIAERPRTYLPGWRFRLRIEVADENRPLGEYRESILLTTTDTQRPQIVIPVVIQRVRRLRVAPATLYLHPAAGGTMLSGTLFVDDTEGQPVAIASVTPSPPNMVCRFGSGAQARQQIEVSCKPSVIGVNQRCSLKVIFRGPVAEETVVPVVLSARSPARP